MKGIFSFFALAIMLFAPAGFAVEPVTMSGPVPAIAPTYSVSSSSTVIYTIQNNVPKKLPVTISGISNGITRTPVENDCGNQMPAGPSTCNIGIAISPSPAQAGSSINQTLKVNYDGRTALTSSISFFVTMPFIYVTPSPNAQSILKFLLDTANGMFLSNQTAYSSVSQNFNQLTFATVGGVEYAYPVDQNGFVYQCTINADGTFNTCTATPPTPPSWAPHGIAFGTVNGVQYAYVTDVDAGLIYQCSLNGDGSFNQCSLAISASYNAPYGIDFATIAGIQYAYIAEAVTGGSSYGSIYRCTLNSDGSFGTCIATPSSSTPNWIPYAIDFATIGGTQYAYVADNGTTPVGNVYQCTLNPDGFLNSCTTTPNSPPSSNWAPSDIAFANLNGTQYAYVASYQGVSLGGMFVCTLNHDGSFSTCDSTPSSPPVPWQPVGIALRFK